MLSGLMGEEAGVGIAPEFQLYHLGAWFLGMNNFALLPPFPTWASR